MPNCPCGMMPREGYGTVLYVTRTLLDVIAEGIPAFFRTQLYSRLGTSILMDGVCALPDVGFPEFTWEDATDLIGLQAKIDQWFRAWIQAAGCMCAECGGDCGDDYTGEEPELVALDAFNATHHGGGGERTAATYIGRDNQTTVGHVHITRHVNTLIGDLIIVGGNCTGTGGLSVSGSGWTELVQNGGGLQSQAVWWKLATSNGTEAITVTAGSSEDVSAWVGTFRGVDPVTPLAGLQLGSGTGTLMSLVSATLGTDNELVLSCASSRSGTWNGNEATGWTGVSAGNAGSLKQRIQRRSDLSAGATPTTTWGTGTSNSWLSWTVVVQGAQANATDWLSWATAEEVAYGWAVKTAAGDLVDEHTSGGSPKGYRIECRWWDEEGGTLAGEVVEWLVYDLDDNLLATVEVGYFEPVEAAVWPCNFSVDPPDEVPWPEELPDPTACGEASLEGIAEVVCELEAKLDALRAALAFNTGLATVNQGPFIGHWGPSGAETEGNFQTVVLAGLEALANNRLVGYTETMLEEGIEGDLTILVGYPAYRVQFTTIPVWSGRRVAEVPMYEVNSRADQLGWLSFKLSDGLLDSSFLIWENMTICSPVGMSEGCELHVAPGCVCSIYGLTPVYDATVP